SEGGSGRGLWLQCALRADIERVDRRAATDEEAVPERSAKAQIGASLRQVDLAEQIARRAIAAHTVLLRVGPAHAAPHVAVNIAAHSVGNARRKTLGEDLAVGQRPGVDVAAEYPDMRWASVGQARVDDVELFLIR